MDAMCPEYRTTRGGKGHRKQTVPERTVSAVNGATRLCRAHHLLPCVRSMVCKLTRVQHATLSVLAHTHIYIRRERERVCVCVRVVKNRPIHRVNIEIDGIHSSTVKLWPRMLVHALYLLYILYILHFVLRCAALLAWPPGCLEASSLGPGR